MITNKTKAVLCLLSLSALLSVNSSQAVIRGAWKLGAALCSKTGFFVAGMAVYPWLHKHLLVSPEEKRKLLAEDASLAKEDKDQLGNAHRLFGSFVTTARNVRDNSRDMYKNFDRQKMLNYCGAKWQRAKELWNKVGLLRRIHSDE